MTSHSFGYRVKLAKFSKGDTHCFPFENGLHKKKKKNHKWRCKGTPIAKNSDIKSRKEAVGTNI